MPGSAQIDGSGGVDRSPGRELTTVTRRRCVLALAALVIVALGLGIRAVVDAPWAGPAGDALYAVLVYLVVAFLLPRRPVAVVGAVALMGCVVIELFQLTGVPSLLAQAWPPIRLLLGTTFVASDLLVYAVGVLVAGLADAGLKRFASGQNGDLATR